MRTRCQGAEARRNTRPEGGPARGVRYNPPPFRGATRTTPMSAETRAHLTELVTRALAAAAPDAPAGAITFERPRDPAHGDYATTVALQLAKTLKTPPRKVAEQLVAALPASAWIEKPEIAGQAIIFVGLAEGVVIFGFITAIMILGRI